MERFLFAALLAAAAAVARAELRPEWELGAGATVFTLPDYRGSDESREYLLGLSYHIKSQALVGMITAAAEELDGASVLTGELHMSTVSDTILVLQYFARETALTRGVNVLKMRGSRIWTMGRALVNAVPKSPVAIPPSQRR